MLDCSCKYKVIIELDGMSYDELYVFSFEISAAEMKIEAMKKIKRAEEMEKAKRPRPTVNKVKKYYFYLLWFFFLNCKTIYLLLFLTIFFSC